MPDPVDSRIVAVEEHVATDDYFDALEELPVPPGEEPERAFMCKFPSNPTMRNRFTDVDTVVGEMDRAGIDLSVVSLNPPGVQMFADAAQATSLGRLMNDKLADLVLAHPDRLYGLGSLAPQDPAAAATEVKRIMGPLGLGGVIIASHTHGRYLDEPEFEPLLVALEEEDAPLYLHPRSPSPQMLDPYRKYGLLAAVWGFQAEAGLHAIRLIMSGTLDRHPKLRIVLGHLGEGLPFWLWRLDNIYERNYRWAAESLGMVKLELKPSEYIHRNFWVTTSGMSDAQVFQYAVAKLGAERVMFAVDYPYEDSKTAVSLLSSDTLTHESLRLISHVNAERLFRVPSA